MLSFVIRRLISSVVVVLGVLLGTFVIARLAPVDPVRAVLQQRSGSGSRVDPVEYAATRHRLGLDRPLPVQFAGYLANLVHGDLGTSIVNPDRTVRDILVRGIPVSMQLASMAFVVQVVLGNVLGIQAALRPNSVFDRVCITVAVILGAVPSLVWGVVLISLFAVRWRWLPVRGWDGPRDWLLPTATLTLSGLASYARFGRAAVLEQLNRDYVRTARAKGLGQYRVVFGHVLHNAMLPIVTYVAPGFAFLVAGNFVVETMYGVPGVGYYTVTSSLQGDYPVIQATVLLIAVMVTLTNLVTDLLYGALDPRLRRR